MLNRPRLPSTCLDYPVLRRRGRIVRERATPRNANGLELLRSRKIAVFGAEDGRPVDSPPRTLEPWKNSSPR